MQGQARGGVAVERYLRVDYFVEKTRFTHREDRMFTLPRSLGIELTVVEGNVDFKGSVECILANKLI